MFGLVFDVTTTCVAINSMWTVAQDTADRVADGSVSRDRAADYARSRLPDLKGAGYNVSVVRLPEHEVAVTVSLHDAAIRLLGIVPIYNVGVIEAVASSEPKPSNGSDGNRRVAVDGGV